MVETGNLRLISLSLLAILVGCFGETKPRAKLAATRSDLMLLYRILEEYSEENGGLLPYHLGEALKASHTFSEETTNAALVGHSGAPTFADSSGLFYFRSRKGLSSQSPLPLLGTYRSFDLDQGQSHVLLWTDGSTSLVSPDEFDSIVLNYHLWSGNTDTGNH